MRPNRLSSINPSKIGEHPSGTIPSQPADAGGVETVAVERSEFKGILAGMILGDGCLSLSGGKNAFLRIQHTESQKDYLDYKAEILRQLTNVTSYTIKPSGVRNPNTQYACKTKRHPLFTRMYEIVYINKSKEVNLTWLSWLNEHGLAIWYMDDGSLVKNYSCNKSGKKRIYSRVVYLNTCSFSLKQNQLIQKFLKDKFGLVFNIKLTSIKTGYYRLVAGAKTANKLFEIIRPYIVPCMEYKLDMQYQQQPYEGHS